MAKLFKLTVYICDLNGDLDLDKIKDLIDNRALNGIATSCITHYDGEKTGREIEFYDGIDLNQTTSTTKQWERYFSKGRNDKMNGVWVGDNYVNLCDVLNAMDNSIVRDLENDNRLYASDQQFVNAYIERHREKYEEEFSIGGNG